MKVGVKFCGNCNPYVDMPTIFKELSMRAKGITFVRWDDENYDVLLVLSSCGRDCATRPDFTGPVIVATSEAVDRWPVTAGELPDAILVALTKYGTGR
ncbi:hypothetical protein [Thermosinus carboxydivorans]|nr:hypothetical protein [Thermosinus carboxydivorans]